VASQRSECVLSLLIFPQRTDSHAQSGERGYAKGGRHLYSIGSDLSNKQARLLKARALEERRAKLVSEIGAINEQLRTLRLKIAEDLAAFRH
jgi:hypothetical protein